MTIKQSDLLIEGPPRKNRGTIVLAHGAGAPMDSDFMNWVSSGLAEKKFKVVRFEFPYMAEKRISGKKRPPNTAKILEETWHSVIHLLGPEKLIIGGKSMGGRIASCVADQASVAGVVCLGYPFHPPGKPEKLRIDHLIKIKTPTLIVQGERDTFGNKTEVSQLKLGRKIRFQWMTDGDHSFKPRKSSGTTQESNVTQAVTAIEKHVLKWLE